MKKLISAVAAAVFAVSAAGTAAFAADSGSSEKSMVILGDSIASGYSIANGSVEHNYGEICGDYLGCEVDNFAKPGAKTADLLELVNSDANAAKSIVNSDYVVISIGGNDMIGAASEYVGSYALKYNLLKEEYSGTSTINLLSREDLNKLDKTKVANRFSDASKASTFATELNKSLVGTVKTPGGVFYNEVLPGTRDIIEKINEMNPDAEIILQTIYQPLQFSQTYWEKNFGDGGEYAGYKSVVSVLRNLVFERSIGRSDESLIALKDELSAEGVNIKIADVRAEFTAINDGELLSDTNQGHTQYFIDIEKSGDNRDFHPNQKGHLAIAALILEQIGELHDTNSGSLIRTVYSGITDRSSYPPVAYKTYELVAGNLIVEEDEYMLGDVNDDGYVDASDASNILNAYATVATGNVSPFDDLQKLAGDVNKDKAVDSSDASSVLGYYAYTATGGDLTLEEYMSSNK